MDGIVLEALMKYPGTTLEAHPNVYGIWKLTMTRDIDGKWLRMVKCVRFDESGAIPYILDTMSKSLEKSLNNQER